jgi:site-specific recombinase XerD
VVVLPQEPVVSTPKVVVQELLGHTRSDMTQKYVKYAKTNRLRKMLEEAGL